MAHISKAIRIISAVWLVVVFLTLLIAVPYILGRTSITSPLEDPVIQMIFLLVASAIPAAFGLAYASHRRQVEETEDWMKGLM